MVLLGLLFLGLACSDSSEPEAEPESTEEAAGLAANLVTGVSVPADCPEVRSTVGVAFDQALHDELVAMLERDQAGRTGGSDPEGDPARTERLREVLAEHGWPGYELVGEDGEDAAWAIAQHADLDLDFQRCALAHLEASVAEEQASPGNLAYLHDRIAVAEGQPQRFGTQLGCDGTEPSPATPLEDPDRIDGLRAAATLPPWADYLAEFEVICQEPQG